MLTREERQVQFVKLVRKMRTAQKEHARHESRNYESDFFRTRNQTLLEDAKNYQRQVDRALKRFERATNEPFGYHHDA